MKTQNFDVKQMYSAVSNFQELGTGRDYKRVLVGSTDDARTAIFYFVGNISHNWPSWNQIAIKVDKRIKTFDTTTRTYDGRPGYFFLWNPLTDNLWNRQIERDKILKWIENAEPQDFIAMAELIVDETGSDCRIEKYLGLEKLNLRRIQIEIYKLDVPALRRLLSVAEVGPDRSSLLKIAA